MGWQSREQRESVSSMLVHKWYLGLEIVFIIIQNVMMVYIVIMLMVKNTYLPSRARLF